jgi:two-component system alkaline phosphatase synthesis response regulator PhoP
MAERATVLIVDDDRTIVDVLRAALEDEGYTVLAALNEAALALARQEQPAVILLDLMMPEMDGVEMCRRLRADPATAHIPIVALSAARNLAVVAGRMSIDDRLPKPFDLDDVSAMVARWTRPR